MFILVQLPFVDLRPMVSGEMGRLQAPDWTADDPGVTFVRGFGKMATRNSKGFGLVGERAFSDFNNAVRFMDPLVYRQQDWPGALPVNLWFRRLYFDGKLAGRFEYGFIVDPDDEDRVRLNADEFAYDIGQLANEVQAISIIVRSMDGGQNYTTVGTCGEALTLAYIMATTKQDTLSTFPPAETYGKTVAMGHPLIHLRVSEGKAVKASRDRRNLEGGNGKLFITSAKQAATRNNVIVQLSDGKVMDESAQERAVRVLFSHMNALLFAESHFLRVNKDLKLGAHSALREAVRDMLARFERVGPSGPESPNDKEFADAIKVFASAYAGRSEQLAASIEELATQLNRPSRAASVGVAVKNYMERLIELVVATGVKASVEAGMKIS